MNKYQMSVEFLLLNMMPDDFSKWCTNMLDALYDADDVMDGDLTVTYSTQRVTFDFIVPGQDPFDTLSYAVPALEFAMGRAGYVDAFPTIATPVLVEEVTA